MRYEIVSWIDGERAQWWKVWGARRASGVAKSVIGEYEAVGATDFEVAIFRTRSNEMLAFFSSRQGGWQEQG